jgi:transcription initiation factor TFIIE subunit alpha
MQIKLLKSIVETLIGKPAVPIIDLLFGKKHVNEFLIAKKLKLTINQTRNILYKMSDYGLVSFTRKKDKRKGWYIYFWTLNIFESLSLLEENLGKELVQLEEDLKSRKEKRFFVCNTCSLEVSEESALISDFVCPECEEVYQLSENKENILQLEKEISRVKKEIENVSNERKIEGEKLSKKKIKKIQFAEAEKKEKRKKNREIKKKEREKAIKKSGKTKKGKPGLLSRNNKNSKNAANAVKRKKKNKSGKSKKKI